MSVQEVENMNKSQEYAVEENIKTELNTSVASENSYQIIKENIFKKHNIALSPEFIYSKNPKVCRCEILPVATKCRFHKYTFRYLIKKQSFVMETTCPISQLKLRMCVVRI